MQRWGMTMRNKLLLLICLMILWPFHALHAQIIDIAGSTTVQAFIEPAADAYRRKHPDVMIHIRGGGSATGFASVLDDRATLGMMSREMKPEEERGMLAAGMQRIRVGYDAIAIVVSDAVFHQGKIHGLQKADIAGIYLARIQSWNELGGKEREILPLARSIGSGTRSLFNDVILDGSAEPAGLQVVQLSSNREMKTVLLASDQAIGFLPFGMISDDRIHALKLIDGKRVCVVDEQSVRDGSYPLARSLYVLYKRDTPPYVRDFVRFLRSGEGQSILHQSGYITLRRIGSGEQGAVRE